MVNLRGKSFLKVADLSVLELNHLLDLSHSLKAQKYNGVVDRPLYGKNIVLLFQKDSTRTRSAFEVAGVDLGMGVTYIGPSGSQFAKKESIEDSAKVFGRFYDGIQFRGYAHVDAENLAANAGVPVWNGLTDDWHPTQMIADFMTLQENFGKDLREKKMVYVGDGRNNMANSLMIMAAKMGMEFVSLAPKELQTEASIVKMAEEIAKVTGARISVSDDINGSVKGADAIYTDVWVSMGEPDEAWAQRAKLLVDYQVTSEMMKATGNPKTIFLHCLPSFHNNETSISAEKGKVLGGDFPKLAGGEFEVTDEVFSSYQSKVFDQAENRMHSIKAIMLATIGQ